MLGNRLQQKGRLPNAGVATNQHDPAGHHATAQHTIEFIQAHAPARQLHHRDLAETLHTHGRRKADGSRCRLSGGRCATHRQRVPGATAVALPLPLRMGLAAGLTQKNCLVLAHRFLGTRGVTAVSNS